MAKKPSTPAPPPPIPSIASQIADKLKVYQGLVITLTVLGAFVGAVWGGLVKVGLDPVGSGTLAQVQAEISRKMEEGDKLLQREIDSKIAAALIPLRTEIANLQQEVGQRKRDLWRFQIENLDAQEAQIVWSQLPQVNANIAGIDRQLQERAGDPWLLQRKSEVENAKKNIEARLETIRSRLKALREQP